MAFVTIRLRVDGEEQYARAFELMDAQAADMTEPLRDAAGILRDSIGRNFLTEGGNVGHWAPLSAPYAAWKLSHYGPMPLLVATGRMRGELLAPGAFTVTPERMVYEPGNDIAIFHQRGTRHMPQRKVVELTAEDRRDIDRAFADWVNALRHRSGLRGGRV